MIEFTHPSYTLTRSITVRSQVSNLHGDHKGNYQQKLKNSHKIIKRYSFFQLFHHKRSGESKLNRYFSKQQSNKTNFTNLPLRKNKKNDNVQPPLTTPHSSYTPSCPNPDFFLIHLNSHTININKKTPQIWD